MRTETAWQPDVWEEDPFAALAERAAGSVVLQSAAPNQIELRKTSAAGIGEMVSLFAGIHALYQEEDAQKALSLFEQITPSAESLSYRARALLNMDRREQAIAVLQQALSVDPNYAQGNALLGDLLIAAGSFPEAVTSYQLASKANQQFTTSRAVFFDGRLYARESFRSQKYTEAKEQETAWMLVLDPSSGSIAERYHLPGIPKAFTFQKDSVQILVDTGFGGESTLVFQEGKFDRAVFGEQDPLLRIQSMQSGWTLAANFMEDWENVESLGQARFAAGKVVYDDAPRTLPELETALRAALQRDATQPWHLFFLGEALWWQGKKEEAEETWNKITAAMFPHLPYYELSWMASLFEGFGQAVWADHAYN
ncbi:MAG TPA: tetratricopeptide repeat protein, partial [Acidobacteriota bacterium]|nr:tetratricopeptide repeat protein [Acidobacteriota bacterium]